MKRLAFTYLFICFGFCVNAQTAIFKKGDLQSFSSKKFFRSLFVNKQQFKNLRLVHDSLSGDEFWMNAQEVTNEEYRNFTDYCRDSIARIYTGYLRSAGNGEEEIDWRKPFVWDIHVAEAIDYLLDTNSYNNRNYEDLRLDVDVVKVRYGKWFDTNNIVTVYPDTTCWQKENAEDTITGKIYFSASYLKNHPVVGVSYWQAMAYCKWLQQIWNSALQKAGDTSNYFEVRLPDENEYKAALQIEGSEVGDVVFPAAARLKSKNAIYNLSGNVAEWLYDSADFHTNTANTKTITGISTPLENIDIHQPATAQRTYIGFRYIVRLKKRDGCTKQVNG